MVEQCVVNENFLYEWVLVNAVNFPRTFAQILITLLDVC